MPKPFKIYFIGAGALFLLFLVFPILVFFAFLILTALLWGGLFTTAYWLARFRFRRGLAVVAAIALTGLVLWLVPQWSVLKARMTLARYQFPNVASNAPIQPQGDVRIDTQDPLLDRANQQKLGFQPYACDVRCLTLLFEPTVQSVTMTRTATLEDIREGGSRLDGNARTYRLRPMAQCSDRGLQPNLYLPDGLFGRTSDENEAIAAELSLKLTTDVCLVGEAPIEHYDILLRTWRSDRQSRWAWPNGTADASYGEIRGRDGLILFRRIDLVVPALFAPLFIDFVGSDFRLGWATRTLPSGEARGWDNPIRDVDAALAVRRTFDSATVLISVRRAVRAALETPSNSDAVISSVADGYVELLAKANPKPEDLALIADLFRDVRLKHFRRPSDLRKILKPEQLDELRSQASNPAQVGWGP